MRDAVKFILERMDTNPEEFIQGSRSLKKETKHNWVPAINEYKKFFNEAEREAVQSKLSEINLAEMKSYIAEQLLITKDEDEDVIEPMSQQRLSELVKAFQQTQEVKKIQLSQHQFELMHKLAMEERNL